MDTTAIADDGVTTLRLVSEDGKVLAEFTIEKHTKEIDKAKIIGAKGSRPGSAGNTAGSVSFEIESEVQIKKAYYVVKERSTNSTATTPSTTIRSEFDEDTPYLEVVDNKVVDGRVPAANEIKAYDVFFVLEDEYGSISTHLCNSTDDETGVVSAVIPVDNFTDTAKTIVKAEMPVLEDETATTAAKVSFTVSEALATSDTFVVVLYKDGKPIAEYTTVAADITAGTKEVSLVLNSKFITDSDLKAGKYKISVFGKGDYDTEPSETVYSEEVTVTPLTSVTDLKFGVDINNNSKLSWKTSHNKFDIKGYEAKVAYYDQTTKDYKDFDTVSAISTATASQSNDDPTVMEIVGNGSSTLTEIAANTLYKAQVVVEAKTSHKLSEANSLPTVSKEFFKVEKPGVVSNIATESTATLELSTSKGKVSGKDATYKVEIYTVNEEEASGKTEARYNGPISTQDVSVNSSSGRFEITGLTENTKYAIRLTATVQGVDGTVEGKSQFVELDKTKKAMFDIINKEVVTSGTDTRDGKICYSGSNIVSIDGVDYNTNDYVGLKKVYDIVKELQDGDKITYSPETPNEVSITIGTINTQTARTLPAAVKGMKVNVTGNSYNQTLKATSTKEPEEVVITGAENGSLDITTLVANRIVLNNATVKTKASQEVIIAEGAEVNFTSAQYVASASKETPVVVDTHTISIVTTDVNSNNNLEFKDVVGGLEITFNGEGTTATEQSGKVVVTGKGDITVDPNGLKVSSAIEVTTEDGDVDISDSKLEGAQTVNVARTDTTSHTVTALANEGAPFAMISALAIKHYDYNNGSGSDYTAVVTAIPSIIVKTNSGLDESSPTEVEDKEATKANFDKLNEYLAKFQLTDTAIDGTTSGKSGATIEVAKEGSKVVTITFNKDTKNKEGKVTNLPIAGLQK